MESRASRGRVAKIEARIDVFDKVVVDLEVCYRPYFAASRGRLGPRLFGTIPARRDE